MPGYPGAFVFCTNNPSPPSCWQPTSPSRSRNLVTVCFRGRRPPTQPAAVMVDDHGEVSPRAGETRATQLVQEIGVRVDVHHIELAQRLHPTAERIADRMIAADRDHQRSALDDAPRSARDPPVICLSVQALDRNVTNVRHRHPDQIVAIGLHVVPALRPRSSPRGRPRIVELRRRRLARCPRPRPLTVDPRLRPATVVRHAKERDLRIEHVEAAHARHPKECPRRRIDQRCQGIHTGSVTEKTRIRALAKRQRSTPALPSRGDCLVAASCESTSLQTPN